MDTPRKILMIEDNEMNRHMLSRRLSKCGFVIVMAVDGDEGLRMAHAERPDLILTDVNHPGVDGLELTRRLKASPVTCKIPILVVSACNMASDRENALAAGADDFEPKPVDFKRLLGKIELHLPKPT